jgi:hypothetical protein
VRAPSQWKRPAAAEECSASRDMLNEHEELTIDEGTISLSSNYSQEYVLILIIPLPFSKSSLAVTFNGFHFAKLLFLAYNRLLTLLSQALQSSGIDLSQASISVQINLGKRASNKQPGTTGTTSTTEVSCYYDCYTFLLLPSFVKTMFWSKHCHLPILALALAT